MLRKSDHSPINYKRVAEADGKEVPWDEIVKGFEYEKGKYVILKEEDFARVDVEATQTVDTINFVKIDDVDPLLFYEPYYLEVGKGGDKAYVLLRDALTDEYRDALKNLIEEKIEHGDKAAPSPPKKKRPSNVVDLVSILQESIQQSQGKAKASATRAQPKSGKANRRKAA